MRLLTSGSRVIWLLTVALAASLGALAAVFTTLALAPRPTAELPLYATATDAGTSMSMATGFIDGDMEGVFILDFVTGELAGIVLNSNKPDLIGGLFKTNVVKDLGVEADKKPAYRLVTGAANFVVGKAGAKQPGRCVVYVLDENSGNFAGYGFEWNPLAAKMKEFQAGPLVPLCKSKVGAAKGA
jgi:hypothetical protein